MTISAALLVRALRSVDISRLHVDACVFRVVSPFKNLDLNHAFIEVEIHKLSHDIVAFPCVNQAHASVAISPEWLISRE